MNRRGYKLELYNKAHYGYETHSELMNFTMPVVMSSKKYVLHFDNAAIGYTSTEGLVLTGQGSTNDITIKNDADTTVLSIATGTTTTAGPNVNKIGSPLAGIISSFTRSLTPSATGCNNPRGPAYSGPIRCCTPAEIFRSNQTTTNTPKKAATTTARTGKGIQRIEAVFSENPSWVNN